MECLTGNRELLTSRYRSGEEKKAEESEQRELSAMPDACNDTRRKTTKDCTVGGSEGYYFFISYDALDDNLYHLL